jgi:hypothetical protein
VTSNPGGVLQFKPLSSDGVSRALEKAERYRLLNEPGEAESICHDILAVEPTHQAAVVTLVLALSDQFDRELGERLTKARRLLERIEGEYERAYYTGVVWERRGKAILKKHGPGAGHDAYDCFVEAMRWFEKAEATSAPGHDDAMLRWNACARKLNSSRELRPRVEERHEPVLE